jgi:mannosyltransferase OCH1-like enzyme
MQIIPKIIHQIWSEKYNPLPQFFQVLAETWKTKHEDWQYIHWNEQAINDFMHREFPELISMYETFPFDIQRWDAVRFLIMYRYGGMYADFDYECLENMEPLLADKNCCIALEPETHCKMYGIARVLNAALFACTPRHKYLKKVINRVFSIKTTDFDRSNRAMCILNTTGPLMLSEVYESMSEAEKEDVYLISAKHVTPFDRRQIEQVKAGIENEELENCLQNAFALHYFTTTWVDNLNNDKR